MYPDSILGASRFDRIYLDFDGVVNVHGSRAPKQLPPWTERTGWGKRAETRIPADGIWYKVWYAPELVAALREIADDGTEIIWLTTWRAHTRQFHAAIPGMPDFPWLDWQDGRSFYDGKGVALADDLAERPLPPERVAWIDDELEERNVHGAIEFPTIPWDGITADLIAALRG